MWVLKQKATDKLEDADDRVVVARGEGGGGRTNKGKGIEYIGTEGDKTGQ